jgi:predicted DNA-binding protein with PD1-like motif
MFSDPNMRHVLLLAALSSLCLAQQTRREAFNPTPTDAKPNSTDVPDAYAIPAKFERVLILRMKYETDLLAGIQKLVKEYGIHNGVILAGTGSVRNYHVHVVGNRTFPAKDLFLKDPAGSADILNLNGYIIDGRVHAHITLATAEKAFGGHLEAGTNAFAFAMVTVGVLADGVSLARIDDMTYR